MSIRIFIADDHAIFRSGLRAFLEKESDFAVVGEAGDAPTALTGLARCDCDVLVLDIHMPGPPVRRTIEEALRARPDLGIVILTMHEDETYLREVFKAGARGFVIKKSTGTELIAAIRSVRAGRVHVDPALSHILVSSYVDPAPEAKGERSALSTREEEILRLLALGHTNSEVARQLNISKRTVEAHREHIMEKLGLETRAQLVSYAMEQGLLK